MMEYGDAPTVPRFSPEPAEKAESVGTIQIPIPTAQAEGGVATVAPHPYVTVDDLLALQLVADPQISPDGSAIAYTILQSHGEPDTTSSAIWLLTFKEGKAETPVQISSGEYHDSLPRWSPDGKTLAFVSDRGNSPQIYLLSMSGGEARQVGQFAQGVNEYCWRPDGTALLVQSAWKLADEQDLPDRSATAIVYTRLDEQWDGRGYKQGRHLQLWLLPLDDKPERLTSEPVDVVDFCWSPDGTQIAFCANRRPDPDLSVSMALWVLTLATGDLRRLTPETGLAQRPAWSPDGQHIAYFYTADQTEASNVLPWVVNTSGTPEAEPAVADTEDITCQTWVIDEFRSEYIHPPLWFPDGKALLITVQKRGQVHLYRLEREQKQLTQLTKGNGRYLSPHMSRDGQRIAMIRADWFTPGDVWSMDSQGNQLQKLTGVNDSFLRSHQLIRPKRITWLSDDGLEIEGFLYLPPLADGQKAPLILQVHGGPSLAWGDAYVHEFQVLAGKGFAVLAPNPRGSAGYGEEFCKKSLNDWGGNDFRDLMAGLEYLFDNEPIDEHRLGIGGISYGGYMTNWAITQTRRFKAAVSRNGISYLPNMALLSDQTLWFDLAMRGLLEGEQIDEALRHEQSSLPFVNQITTPLLLLHAEDDLRCPLSESYQLFVALRKRKHTVELVRYPHTSHLIDWPGVGTPQQRVDRLRRTVAWFERFV